jgi:hypothetical protein
MPRAAEGQAQTRVHRQRILRLRRLGAVGEAQICQDMSFSRFGMFDGLPLGRPFCISGAGFGALRERIAAMTVTAGHDFTPFVTAASGKPRKSRALLDVRTTSPGHRSRDVKNSLRGRQRLISRKSLNSGRFAYRLQAPVVVFVS